MINPAQAMMIGPVRVRRARTKGDGGRHSLHLSFWRCALDGGSAAFVLPLGGETVPAGFGPVVGVVTQAVSGCAPITERVV